MIWFKNPSFRGDNHVSMVQLEWNKTRRRRASQVVSRTNHVKGWMGSMVYKQGVVVEVEHEAGRQGHAAQLA